MPRLAQFVEPVAVRLDTRNARLVLFFMDVKEGDGRVATWGMGGGHSPANIEDPQYVPCPDWAMAEQVMSQYRKQYRGSYHLARHL